MKHGRAMEVVLNYFTNKGKDRVLEAPTSPINQRIDVLETQVGNSTGSAASMGWGYEVLDSEWKAGLWDDSATPAYIDDTEDAQDVGTGDFPIGSDTVANDGCVIQATDKFNIVRFDIGTAEVGSASVSEFTYWNGSAWATLQTLEAPDFTSTGDQYLTFLTPADWAPLVSTDAPVSDDELDAGKYAIRLRFTTAAGTSAPIADELSVVRLLDYVESVADGAAATEEYSPGTMQVPAGSAVVPYASTADNNNWIKIKFSKG